MKYKQLGNSCFSLTTVGLGTWAIGGGSWEWGWGPQDDEDSIRTILRALELGINWIDTAPVYGLGHSEEVVGIALKKWKNKVIVATKCGNIWDKGETMVHGCLKPDNIKNKVEDSLRRLNVEVIDLYQIHWPRPDEDLEEGWGAVADLIKVGKVRYGGVCNCNLEQLKRIQPIHAVISLQNPYSMLNREIEKGLLSYCAEKNIGILAYSPLQTGLLTGKYTKTNIKRLPENDWRSSLSPYFQEPMVSANLHLVEKLKPIAVRNNMTLSQLAIAWVLRRSEVTAAIIGARHPLQIEETVLGGDFVLTSRDLNGIDELLEEHERSIALKNAK